ncbi:F0F1 ATP synthase subunit delta [Mesomycoplasma neurolyticum]|uniref:ATP synthase subunit delta n=1 Tax=Mesomycoplasma neurolyticum TaxID=2120 RepID=A0A449A4T2_9BACT|nr:F0F1 ATP synthase subunit delta [Mesomycoplasma neurolyticum]VEU59247.1 F0F1 ATP synthase subunit delta [Mesomycoplasma neurolyticum]
MNKIKSSNYAHALFSIALEEKKIKSFLNHLQEINNIFLANEKIFFILSSFNLTQDEKEDIIDKIFQNTVFEKTIINFLKLLTKKRYINKLPEIFNTFQKEAFQHLNIKKGVVYSTRILNENEMQKLVNKIKEKINCEIHLVNEIDTSLIAGIKIEIENHIFENSIISKLEGIKDYILKEKTNGF